MTASPAAQLPRRQRRTKRTWRIFRLPHFYRQCRIDYRPASTRVLGKSSALLWISPALLIGCSTYLSGGLVRSSEHPRSFLYIKRCHGQSRSLRAALTYLFSNAECIPCVCRSLSGHHVQQKRLSSYSLSSWFVFSRMISAFVDICIDWQYFGTI